MEKELLELNPQAAYNEARKINRFLKEFERFESVLAVLAEFDITAKKLQAQIGELESQKKGLEDSMKVVVQELAQAKTETIKAKADATALIAAAKEEANKLESATQLTLRGLKVAAANEVDALRDSLKTLRPQVDALATEKRLLESDIDRLRKLARSQSEKVAQALKDLS